jgi:hypothetical protein
VLGGERSHERYARPYAQHRTPSRPGNQSPHPHHDTLRTRQFTYFCMAPSNASVFSALVIPARMHFSFWPRAKTDDVLPCDLS